MDIFVTKFMIQYEMYLTNTTAAGAAAAAAASATTITTYHY
jgi:hypothetical protein